MTRQPMLLTLLYLATFLALPLYLKKRLSYIEAQLWSGLPSELRQVTSLSIFSQISVATILRKNFKVGLQEKQPLSF